MMLLNVFQVTGVRLGVSSTWNVSLVGARQLSRKPLVLPMFVWIMVKNIGDDGRMLTVKEFVALKVVSELVTIVVNKIFPVGWFVGIAQVITPLLEIVALFDGEVVKV